MLLKPAATFGPAPAPTAVFATASNVVQERHSANCRVETGAASSRVIILERDITNGGILSASDISKERGIANGVVTESGRVSVERKGADSTVE